MYNPERGAARLVERSRLLAVVRALRPTILAACAPAGYGKTTFVAQLLGDAPATVLDCSRCLTSTEFARLLMDALRHEGSAENRLPVASRTIEDFVTPVEALRTWCASESEQIFVFENVDALDARGRELLRSCIRYVVRRAMVTICSRSFVNLPFSRGLGPTNVITLGPNELAFDRDEIATLFSKAIAPREVDALERLTEGWPLALAIYSRAYALGAMDYLMRDPEHVELGRLEGYMGAEILAGLNQADLRTLCLLSLTDGLGADELAVALPMSRHEIPLHMKRLPLTSYDGSRYSLHPLLSRCVARQHRELRRLAGCAAADALSAEGQCGIAAKLAFASGDTARVASILRSGGLGASPLPDDVRMTIEGIDASTLVLLPHLWNVAMPYRISDLTLPEWRDEARVAWDALPADTDVETLLGVAHHVCAAQIVTGRWREFDAFRLHLESAGIADSTAAARLAAFVDAWASTARMRTVDLESLLETLGPMLSTAYFRSLVYARIISAVHRLNGDHEAERSALREAIDAAERSRVPYALALALQQAAVSAFLFGDDDLDDHLKSLEELRCSGLHTQAVEAFLNCIHGRAAADDVRGTEPALRALAFLIGAERCSDARARATMLQQAVAVADFANHPEPMILTRLAAYAADPGDVHRFEEARRLLAGIDDTAYHHADMPPNSAAAPFPPVLSRFAPGSTPSQRLVVELLAGCVRSNRGRVELSAREFALLAYLALQERAVNVDVVADSLWPDATTEDGLASIRVYVNRVRRRLNDPNVILSHKRAYGPGEHLVTDIGEMERRVRQVATGTPALSDLFTLRDGLVAGPPAWIADLAGLTSLQGRINALIDEIDEALAERRTLGTDAEKARIDAALEHDLALADST